MNTSSNTAPRGLIGLRTSQTRFFTGWVQIVTMLTIILQPLSFCRADDPEIWYFAGTQCSVSPNAVVMNESHPGHPFTGQQRTIRIAPTITTWNYWMSNKGNVQNGASTTLPFVPEGARVTCGIEIGSGTTSITSEVPIGEEGYVETTFVMGSEPMNRVVVNIGYDHPMGYFAYATAWLEFEQPTFADETWTYDSTQCSVISSIYAGKNQLEPGESTLVYLHADYQTWEVWKSNYDRTEIREFQSGPASGAIFSAYTSHHDHDAGAWDWDSGGSATATATQLDEMGNGEATVTMGTQGSKCFFEVGFNYGDVAGSTSYMTFTKVNPAETWTQTGTEGSISATMSAEGSLSNVSPGQTRNVTTSVTYSTWEVWTSNYGHVENRNGSTSPAVGATVTYSIEGPDGSFTTASPSTDGSGQSAATFTMGSSNARLRADVSFLDTTSVFTSLDFSTPVAGDWVLDHSDGSLTATLWASSGAATASLAANVSYTSWDVYRHTGTQATENRNFSSGTVENASLAWTGSSGDAQVTGDVGTGITGNAGGTAVLGTQGSTITLTANYSGMTASASATVGICTQDSDGDGYSDAAENAADSDPQNRDSTPATTPPPPVETGRTIKVVGAWHLTLSHTEWLDEGFDPTAEPGAVVPRTWKWITTDSYDFRVMTYVVISYSDGTSTTEPYGEMRLRELGKDDDGGGIYMYNIASQGCVFQYPGDPSPDGSNSPHMPTAPTHTPPTPDET